MSIDQSTEISMLTLFLILCLRTIMRIDLSISVLLLLKNQILSFKKFKKLISLETINLHHEIRDISLLIWVEWPQMITDLLKWEEFSLSKLNKKNQSFQPKHERLKMGIDLIAFQKTTNSHLQKEAQLKLLSLMFLSMIPFCMIIAWCWLLITIETSIFLRSRVLIRWLMMLFDWSCKMLKNSWLVSI